MIRPIETTYKGYRFRSRLEARWAVFFDALGVPWEYEKQGYSLPSGPYLPDFWLPIDHPEHAAAGYWVEIKPIAPTALEKSLCEELAFLTRHHVILIAGPPDPGRFEVFKTVVGPRYPNGPDGDPLPDDPWDGRRLFGMAVSYPGSRERELFLSYTHCHAPGAAFSASPSEVDAALATARAARFEHGETP